MASTSLIANSLILAAPLITNTSAFQQIVNTKSSKKQLAQKAKIPSKATAQVAFHLKTCYLFLKSDLKTVILPWTLFGLSHAIAAPILDAPTSASTLSIFARLPLAVFWLLINLLPFTIGNQCGEQAIREDKVNKPWRPIAAERITAEHAKKLEFTCHAIAFFISRQTGGAIQALTILISGIAYNNLGFGDNNWITRGLLCGIGYIAFGTGAMEVMLGAEKAYSATMVEWFALLIVVIAAGVHAADIYDQEGDYMVGRDTLPLAIGDLLSRCVLAIAIFIPSFLCPWFCGCSVAAYILPVVSGLYVARRTLIKRGVKADRKTYMLWNLWLVFIYCLPLERFLTA